MYYRTCKCTYMHIYMHTYYTIHISVSKVRYLPCDLDQYLDPKLAPDGTGSLAVRVLLQRGQILLSVVHADDDCSAFLTLMCAACA